MQQTAFTVLEETPMLLSLAVLLVSAALVTLGVLGAQPDSRQSAFSLSVSVIALILTGTGLFLQYGTVTLFHADMGLHLAVMVLCAVSVVAGLHDRIGGLARLCVAMVTVGMLAAIAMPLQMDWFGATTSVPAFFMALVSTGVALLMLCLMTAPHRARFTQYGAMRVGAQPHNAAIAVASFGLAIGLSLLLWRIKAFAGVNTSFHVYSALMASIICATTAGAIARIRRFPFVVKTAALALPAGVLAAGAFDAASMPTIISAAITMGACVAITMAALPVHRIDEPSGLVAGVTFPAIAAWLMVAMQDTALLASHIHMLGLWVFSGIIMACVARVLCAACVGYTPSHRRIAEGMDATSAR